MKRDRRRYLTTMLVAAAATGAGPALDADAGCPCGKKSGAVYSSTPWSGAAAAAVRPMPVAVEPAPSRLTQPVQPPPGSIGRTYQIKSRPVPASMHPRVGMIDINVPEASKVLVHDMNPTRYEDAMEGFQDPDTPSWWHFQSKPLIPGLPHIYRVEATFDSPDGPVVEERYVRLIMGRLIELEF